MKYSKELLEIVKTKKFKSFWHCFDYLHLAGYNIMDSFGVSLHEFGESKIYSDVAFVKVSKKTSILGYGNGHPSGQIVVSKLRIGLIDDTNIHLAGLYKTYREWIAKDNTTSYPDVEETCEVIELPITDEFIMDYLVSVSRLHFGFEAFKFDKSELPRRRVDGQLDHPDAVDAMIRALGDPTRFDDMHRRLDQMTNRRNDYR